MNPNEFETKLVQLENYACKTRLHAGFHLPAQPSETDYLELAEKTLIRKPIEAGLSIANEPGMPEEFFRQIGVGYGLIERLQYANPLLELPDGCTVGAALEQATHRLGRFASVATFFGATELFDDVESQHLIAHDV